MVTARVIKSVGARTPFLRDLLFYRYDYMFSPGQLAFLINCLDETARLPGPIVEIGVAAGNTTVFLNKHLDEIGSERRYICIDTFAGFTPEDIAAERRRNNPGPYELLFRAYKRPWFERTLAQNGISRVQTIEADVNELDFSAIDTISFCLIDVDLYRPVARALERVFPRMAPGGIIVVDDCVAGSYEGALSAYSQFVGGRALPSELRHGKLGVIRLPTTASHQSGSTPPSQVAS